MLAIQRGEKGICDDHRSSHHRLQQGPESDRAFFRDFLNFPAVDAGHGWLIFALPPAEAAFHPSEKNDLHELYFMCDDLKSTMESLKGKKAKCGSVKEER